MVFVEETLYPKRCPTFFFIQSDVWLVREIEVLEGVASGERNKVIAYRLGITERTVKAHLTHIYQKLSVDSRAAAVAEASKLDLL